MSLAAVWHDVECGGYTADLDAGSELAAGSTAPCWSSGCGTGRVALHLARRGSEVWAVDADRPLIDALRHARSRRGSTSVPYCADVRGWRSTGISS